MQYLEDIKRLLRTSFIITVSVRSGAFRHNQDSAGTHGLYRHNKTSLLAQSAKMTPTENVPGIKQPKKDTYRVKRK